MKTLAVFSDFPEEGWPSMDVVAAGLVAGLTATLNGPINPTRLCARYRSRLSRVSEHGIARNVDRLWNRQIVYPHFVKKIRGTFDLYHVVDHSYAHLVHALPQSRTGVFCHDLDAFRCLLEPAVEPRPRWFRAMTRRILSGMSKAAVVFHSTDVIGTQIRTYGIVDPARLIKAPYGVSSDFQPARIDEPDPLPPDVPTDRPFILHVGSCIPRKRIDVLLEAFAAIRREIPEMLLVKIGGIWTAAQTAQIQRLQLSSSIIHMENIERRGIAACYRQARLTMVTSEAEGFGLPVSEGLACGSVVVCSDIPVLREVGGDAAVYAPMANVDAWRDVVLKLLRDPSAAPSHELRSARASLFTWKHHAEIISSAYQKLS